MLESEKQALRSRIRRLEGQVRSLERQLNEPDSLVALSQFEAVAAAARACLFAYLVAVFPVADQGLQAKILKRLERHL